MFRRPFAALLVLFAFSALPARADDLSALIDKYIAWRGGPAFEHMTSFHLAATVEVAGLSGPVELWEDRDGRMRNASDLGVIKSVHVSTPADSWSLTPSGQVETLPVSEVESSRRGAVLDFADAIRGGAGARLALLGSENRDGQTWSVVRVSFGDEDTYDAFIDPKTGAIDGWRIKEDRLTHFDKYGDWRMVDGVRMAFLEAETSDLPGGNATVHIASADLNHALSPLLFVRPGAVRRAVFEDGARSTPWIDFEIYDDHIYFPAKVNGHLIKVMLDSGSSTSVLDRGYAASIGLKDKGGFTSMGAGGADTSGVINGVEIEIGNLKLKDLTVGAMDIDAIGQRMGRPLPAILGNEVFNELAVDIDFANRRIAFREPSSVTPPPGAVQVPLNRAPGLRSIPVSVEGRAPVPFDFDLGNGAPLLVFPAYYQAQKLLQTRPSSKAIGGAIGGIHAETIATLRKVTLAGVAFTEVPTVFPPDVESGVNSTRTLGNVGLPILSRFHLIIDYSHDRLFATANPETIAAPFARDRTGIVLGREEKGFKIEFIAPGSPGETGGLKVGDKVVLIDRKPVDAWPTEQLMGLSMGPTGTQVEFTLEGGTVRRVTLADYF
jgi:hypothetical protein